MPISEDKNSPMAVSMIIAITGHRDLYPEDFDGFQAQIEKIFEEQKRLYPSTPLLLVSGLAEGADRIAAHAARKLLIDYIAVLPMERELYVADFSGDESICEFDDLYNNAATQLLIPYPAGVTSEDVSFKKECRNRQYESLGAFLVNVSQVMIAVWDRQRTGKIGGTGEVVAMKRAEWHEDAPLAFEIGNRAGAGPVHVLLARRKETGPDFPMGAKCEVLYPDSTNPEEFLRSYDLLEQFNADIEKAIQKAEMQRKAEKNRADLCLGHETTGISPAMHWVAGIYGWADTLAIHYSQRSLRLWQGVFVLLGLGGAALAWLHVSAGTWSGLFIYYFLLIAALVIGSKELRGKGRRRHEDYRALAEALRVQFFWLAAGLDGLAAEKYLRKQVNEMMWIRDAITECALYSMRTKKPQAGEIGRAARLNLAKTWVGGQESYYLKTSLRHERKRQGFNVLALTLASIGFAGPLIAMLGSHLLAQEASGWKEVWYGISEIAMLSAALVWNYSELRGFAQEARQYARMYSLFSAANSDLRRLLTEQTVKSFLAAERTIRDLGQEALAENGDWLSMHREKKLAPGLAVG